MQTSDDFIVVINELATSGKFIVLDRNGRLVRVSKAIQNRTRILKELAEVDRKLRSCNNPAMLAELALWCNARKKDFSSRLRAEVEKLEDSKSKLLATLEEINMGPDIMVEAGVESTVDSETMTSLVPNLVRKGDEFVAERNAVIDDHCDQSAQEICTILDKKFSFERKCYDHLPKGWINKYGIANFTDAYRHAHCRKLVHKMISDRRRAGLAELH